MSVKKFTLTLCALAALSPVFGQQKATISATKLESSRMSYRPLQASSIYNVDAQGAPYAASTGDNSTAIHGSYAGKTAAVNPVVIGRAANAYTFIRSQQNQVAATPDGGGDGKVAFIHRQDVTIWGGGGSASGKLRIDLSQDGGQTWATDLGEVNPVYSRPGRYPNVTFVNTGDQIKAHYYAAVLNPTPDWDGHVSGTMDMATGNPVTATETYNFLAQNTLIPGSICEGMPGEFWANEVGYVGGAAVDSIYTYKGVWNSTSQDVDWQRNSSNIPNFNYSYDGTSYFTTPNIAFSPDGMIGWEAFLGDLVGGHDSVYQPVLRKTTDGGATWGAWMEVDLRNIAWIADSLKILWVDSVGNPASSGRPTTGFDFDITVDANGNPHFFTTVGSASTSTTTTPSYSIFSSLAMFAIDVYSTNGGTSWSADYLAPILSLRGEWGTGADLLVQDNRTQASRSDDGNYVYFSWVDSDTNFTGFGESGNLAPNLRIVGKRIADGYRTCFKLITDGDILWDGKALFPSLAPVSLIKGGGSNHHLPIVIMELTTGDQLQPCAFYYFGGDAVLFESDFVDPANLNLSWDGACTLVSNEVATPSTEVSLFQSFPNPTSGMTTIRFDLPTAQNVSLELVNMYGQSVGVLAQGSMTAGMHEVEVNTAELASGIYFYNLKAGEEVLTKKMIVTK